ncbi:hypothetical protein [Portibacter marinus]|uniref:hypothetical protein n=1 Tax=Portibacter marinus TaxID=2898660 RepID=UPI001F3F3B62|nr:hypothetical protein [Portibacter marinus]
MKLIFKVFILAFLTFAGMNSCQKEQTEIVEAFDLEDYIGRYNFDIELETFRNGESVVSYHQSVGYVTKENDYTIKVLFDFSAPKVDCVYEYVVRTDGSFYSTFRGAGDRTGQFIDGNIQFEEHIDLGYDNFKHLDFVGTNYSK